MGVHDNESFFELSAKMDSIIKLLGDGEQPVKKEWLTGSEVCKLLKISSRTLQNYRDLGKIGFSKNGRKIYYKSSDIDTLLCSCYESSFKPRLKVS